MKTVQLDIFDQPMNLEDGIACFLDWDNWPETLLDKFRNEGFVAQKCSEGVQAIRFPELLPLVEELSQTQGVILELATGPDGGNLPALLAMNPDAVVIANDCSRGVLRLWHEHLISTGLGPNVFCAAFDARSMPIRDSSVAAVSGIVAFSSVPGLGAIRESLRVLRPGGILVAKESVIMDEDLSQLPLDVRNDFERESPIMARGLTQFLTDAGLRVETSVCSEGRKIDANEGALAQAADKMGLAIRVKNEFVKARKPR